MAHAERLLGPAEEHPLAGEQTEAGWCENYAFVANDPGQAIGLCLYMGRQPFDLSIWHEILVLALPDERVLAWKSAGRGGTASGGGGALARFVCAEPGRVWKASFDGFARATTAQALAAGTLADGPWTRTRFELEFTAATPPWILGGDSLEHAWEHSHYEQLGRVAGWVQAGEERYEFDGTGHRDHSRGPRDFRSVLDHAWVNCLFPSGRAFALYRMRLPDGSDGVAAAGVFDGTTLRTAEVVQMPLLAETDRTDGYELLLEVAGEPVRIDVALTTQIGTVSYVTPNHMTIGASTDPAACQVVEERSARFTWDGEVGFGHSQRSRAATD